jgi:hypothetical protein
VAAVFNQFDGIPGFWFIEARPTAVRIKFCLALEEFCTATFAREGAYATFFQELTGVSAFGSGFTKHVILKLA